MKIVVKRRDVRSPCRAFHWCVETSMEQHGSFQSVLSAVAGKDIIYWELIWQARKVQNGLRGGDKSIIRVCKVMSPSIHSIVQANRPKQHSN